MWEPFLNLMADSADVTATIIVLLALWEGRTAPGRSALVHWLGIRTAKKRIEVDDFLNEARRQDVSKRGEASACPERARLNRIDDPGRTALTEGR